MTFQVLPNKPGPEQRAQAMAAYVRRQRLFNTPAPRQVMAAIPPAPVVEVVVDEPDLAPAIFPRLPTARSIMVDTCRKHGITMKELRSDSRARRIIHCRQECFYLMRRYVRRPLTDKPMSLPMIASMFAIDHTTVLHGIRQHTAKLEAGVA